MPYTNDVSVYSCKYSETYLLASSIATAQATLIPTIGLLPISAVVINNILFGF